MISCGLLHLGQSNSDSTMKPECDGEGEVVGNTDLQLQKSMAGNWSGAIVCFSGAAIADPQNVNTNMTDQEENLNSDAKRRKLDTGQFLKALLVSIEIVELF